jgi:hypothetical protein
LQEVFRKEINDMGCDYACLYGAGDVDNFLDWVVKGGEK